MLVSNLKLKIIFSLIALVIFLYPTQTILAENHINFIGPVQTTTETNPEIDAYIFLQQLPGFDSGTFNPNQECAFGKYLNIMIAIFIGVAAVLAMVMIVVGGIEYMGSELISSKEAGKSKIWSAVLGLLLAFGAYLILYEINPSLLNLCLNDLPTVQIRLESHEQTIGVEGGETSVGGQTLSACDENQLTTMNFLNKQVRVNTAIVGDVQSVEQKWNQTLQEIRNKPSSERTAEDKYTAGYTVRTIYNYNCRSVRGGNKVSAHAFGLAFDINANENPYSTDGKCKTDMPAKFIDAFTESGFGWGGNWSSKFDTMHFSKLSTEAQGSHLSGTSSYVTGFSNNIEVVTRVLCPKGN